MLDISIWLIVFTAIIFFILLFLLNRWVYEPMLKFMEDREESIRKDLEKAKENSSGSQELLDEAKEILNRAKLEAAAIKAQAVNEAKSYADSKIEAKKAELAKEYDKFKEKLSKEKEEIKSTLISQAPLFREVLKAKFSKLQ